jgi:hypothetical protein
LTLPERERMGSMRVRLSAVLLSLLVSAVGACGSNGGTNDLTEPDTVSATEYVTGMCTAVAGWVQEIQGLNEDLAANLDPNSLESVKNAMVGFLDDVITSTESVIGDVEDVGIPDVEDGEATAARVLTALGDSKDVFERARDRVAGMSTDDPAAFTQELQALGTDLETSLSGIGQELETFEAPELDEASEDVPECDEAALT